MLRKSRAGFTLIELLTVIAIIGILAGMVITGLGRARERARIASVESTFKQLLNSYTLYFTSNRESYPPRYGYLRQPYDSSLPDEEQYVLKPYTWSIDKFRAFDFYDEFSMSHDTNNDGILQILEYSPPGVKVGPNEYTFGSSLYYDLRAPQGAEATENRPYAYFPVKVSQVKKVAKYYYTHSNPVDAMNARVWDSSDPNLSNLRFPPPRYDAFALISVGPMNDTGGVIPEAIPISGASPGDVYHITALRAFFLATRDANDNMKLDFDFRNRKGSGEDADPATYEAKGMPGELAQLPGLSSGAPTSGYGPLIYVYGYNQ